MRRLVGVCGWRAWGQRGMSRRCDVGSRALGLSRAGCSAVVLTSRRRDWWRAKYRLAAPIVRTMTGGANEAAYNCIFQMEDSEGKRVRLVASCLLTHADGAPRPAIGLHSRNGLGRLCCPLARVDPGLRKRVVRWTAANAAAVHACAAVAPQASS